MSFAQYPTRTDANQAAVLAQLRKHYKAWDIHSVSHDLPDILVMSNSETPVFVLLEVKAKDGCLTEKEIEFHQATIGAPRHLVRSGAEAEQVMKIYDDMELTAKGIK